MTGHPDLLGKGKQEDFMCTEGVGGDGTMSDQIMREKERESTEIDYWKGGQFQGQVKTFHNGISQKSTRKTPAQTPGKSKQVS